MNRNRGVLTWLELLVVGANIAVLSAILLPVFTQVLGKERFQPPLELPDDRNGCCDVCSG